MAIPPGVYRIRNAQTNTFVDQCGPSNDTIHSWSYVQHHRADQHWFVQLSGDGVALRNVEYGQYAYVTNIQNGGKVFASNNLITWNLSPHENEWAISLPGTNFVVEIGGANGANGAGHYQLSQQHFQQLYQEPRSPPVSPGIYFLKNVMSGTLVSLYGGSTEEGAEITGYDFSGGSYQKWQLQLTSHGQNVTLRNVQTSTYLWFRGQSFIPSFPVISSYQSQEYVIAAADRGFYISPAQQPGYALSLLRGSGQNGTEIAIWHNSQQDNQKWHFEHA
ncbi:unnamed protein product [Rhizoctonia solani]|uniref:Ricin B lectin domain-containing protein n=1 Tax=Rhizoctonia solani TaxID=456999 RepID=A0A8H3A6R2_9AGAM|nr:unnamed protein product [Rhizoctonia solani]